MTLKEAVDRILSEKKRTLTWLATEMDRTIDGFKLSLINGSIKYNDLVRMIDILDIPVTQIFPPAKKRYSENDQNSIVAESDHVYKVAAESYKEQITLLKNTIKDKDRIIELLSK